MKNKGSTELEILVWLLILTNFGVFIYEMGQHFTFAHEKEIRNFKVKWEKIK